VFRHHLVNRIEIRLVAAASGNTGFEIIGNQDGADTTEERKHARMSRDPVGHILGESRFYVGVARGAEHSDEDGGFLNLTGGRIVDWDFRAGPIDEDLLSGDMILAHHDVLTVLPLLEVMAETAIGVVAA
jgi:hypothetical protein